MMKKWSTMALDTKNGLEEASKVIPLVDSMIPGKLGKKKLGKTR